MALVGLPLALLLACTGADPDFGPPGPDPRGTSSGSDGGAGAPDGTNEGGDPPEETHTAPPANGPASLRFHNQELRDGFAEGRVRIGRAADESDVTEYVLYWGTSADLKAPGDPIAVLPRGPEEHVFVLAPGTPIPPGATHLIAFTRNTKGEGPHVSASLANVPQLVDVFTSLSADAGHPLQLHRIRTLVDAERERLLVVGEARTPDENGMGTLVCKLDATACTFNWACIGDDCALEPSHAIDHLNDKLLIAADSEEAEGLAGWVCARDGTACQMSDLPALGFPRRAPWVFFRPETNDVVLLYVSNDNAGGVNRLYATMCSAEFSRCPTKNVDLNPLGGGVGDVTGAVRLPDGRFAVATTLLASQRALGLTVTDGTPAGTLSRFVSSPVGSGVNPSMALDTKNERLVIVSTNEANENRLYLTLCPVAGTTCTSVDIGAGAPASSGHSPSVVIDYENDKILVVSKSDAGGGVPRLTRCNLDGTACTTRAFSAGIGEVVYELNAAIDTVGGYLLTAVVYGDNKVAVIRWGL